MIKEAIRRLARINESGKRRRQIHAKEDKSIERTQPKDFNTRVHLKCDKILISDD